MIRYLLPIEVDIFIPPHYPWVFSAFKSAYGYFISHTFIWKYWLCKTFSTHCTIYCFLEENMSFLWARRRAFSAFEDMWAVTERTCLLFYTAGLFDWSVCELVCSVHENTAWTNRHGAIIPIWNDLNACSVISVCHSWVSRRWIWGTDLSFGLWRRVVLSYFPPPLPLAASIHVYK